ncbi:hypothetical protein JCM19037_3494 [Geomicrobium sp. JCM 19037]|uniref:hypothetical protein n=1 Tax=unclassified Geomicrobium TaxID=2628951 RepID=UPI00045F1F4E|nr:MULTISPECIES: hypothetical protein [unclassified Geomicrobium]GAK05030.1 hypothetical protein JCM19037_3494 [Geomicrobium sp. JCM 19037]GAK12415.1 hypothetical protein JCM19039_2186 [Geomicrobium sp. JCM 19039]
MFEITFVMLDKAELEHEESRFDDEEEVRDHYQQLMNAAVAENRPFIALDDDTSLNVHHVSFFYINEI